MRFLGFETLARVRFVVSLVAYGSVVAMSLTVGPQAFAKDQVSKKRTVCTVTINSPQERDTFKRKLDPKKFDFVELTDYHEEGTHGEEWFQKACASGVQCDVLLISGHFAGTFFGTESRMTLSSATMEQASCSRTCDGILKKPQEVFLFGCNTLAGKESDRRTPEQYRRVLLDDGFSATDADRIVQARYGGLGSSFKEQMQRTFAGVPSIHGFDSIGPSGATVKPFLDRYFKANPRYDQHLDRLEASQLVSLIEQGNKATTGVRNTFGETLRGTAYAFCSGVKKGDVLEPIREKLCQLYDEKLPLEDRIATAEDMLIDDNRLYYLPTVSNFFRGISKDQNSAALKRIRGNAKIREALAAIREAEMGSTTGFIELVQLRRQLGFLDDVNYEKELRGILRKKLANLDRESVDTICSSSNSGVAWPNASVEDFSQGSLANPLMTELFRCLPTQDPRLTKVVLDMGSKFKGSERAAILSSLVQMPGLENERYAFALENSQSDDRLVRIWSTGLLFKTAPSDLERSALVKSAFDDGVLWSIWETLETSNFKDETLARHVLNSRAGVQTDWERMSLFTTIAPKTSPVWDEFVIKAQMGQISWQGVGAFASGIAISGPESQAVKNWAVQQMVRDQKLGENTNMAMSYLSSRELSADNKRALVDLLKKESSGDRAAYVRGILRRQKSLEVSPEEKELIGRGEGRLYICKMSEDGKERSCKAYAQ